MNNIFVDNPHNVLPTCNFVKKSTYLVKKPKFFKYLSTISNLIGIKNSMLYIKTDKRL